MARLERESAPRMAMAVFGARRSEFSKATLEP
eukprot:CAMPEP_0175435238 /NCGR_PEP_ID=MMETSP0095-20121207/54321_1 /TAXON_ID=311494 /ORGANISM="Alexandrium monilatum, Strain CCMP3105" /LENGTH=31 /DNA_ID= /DNA_START= /DNA_END= /DNA_ORIENTATION=